MTGEDREAGAPPSPIAGSTPVVGAPSWSRQEALRLALFGRLPFHEEVSKATPHHQQLVLVALIVAADAEGCVNADKQTTSIASMVSDLHMDVRAVRNSVHALNDIGHIHVVKRPGRCDMTAVTLGWLDEAGHPLAYRQVDRAYPMPTGQGSELVTPGPQVGGDLEAPGARGPWVSGDPPPVGPGSPGGTPDPQAGGSTVDHVPQSPGSVRARPDPDGFLPGSGSGSQNSRTEPSGECDPDPTRATRETHTLEDGVAPKNELDPDAAVIRDCLAELGKRIPAYGRLTATCHVHVFAIGLMSGHSAVEVCTAIQQSALKFGEFLAKFPEHQEFMAEQPTHLRRLEAFVGSFITGIGRKRGDSGHLISEEDKVLVSRFLKHWCQEYRRVFRRAYNVAADGSDQRAAMQVLTMARKAAQEEADETGTFLDVERPNAIVKHWIKCYFGDRSAKWVVESDHTLRFFPKQACTYPRPGDRGRRRDAPSPEADASSRQVQDDADGPETTPRGPGPRRPPIVTAPRKARDPVVEAAIDRGDFGAALAVLAKPKSCPAPAASADGEDGDRVA